MKKLFLILFLVLALCACGKTEVPPEVLPESESSSSEEEKPEENPAKQLTSEQVKAMGTLGRFPDYQLYEEELYAWGIDASIIESDFVSRTDFEAKLKLTLGTKELLIPFSGIYDNNGNVYFGTILFPAEKIAAFCGRDKIVFFSTANLEIIEYSPEIPDFEKDDTWINGVAFDRKNKECVVFATPMDHRSGELGKTFALYYGEDAKLIRSEEINIGGSRHALNFYVPKFFSEAEFFEIDGNRFFITDSQFFEEKHGNEYLLGHKISVSNGNFELEMIPYTKNLDYFEKTWIALLRENGIIKESLLFHEEENININYDSESAPPSLEVFEDGKKAVYKDDYFAMELTLDFENRSEKLEYNITDEHIDGRLNTITSADGKYSLQSFGSHGGGDIMYSHISVRNNETGEHRYFGEIGGMYGGYNGIGFLKNSDIYRYDMYNLEIVDPKTLEVKFDINDNFPLWYDEETDSGRRLLTFRRNPEDFSYIVVYFEYENGIGWYDIDGNPTGHDGIANCNYKIGFLDPEGKLVESYDTGYGIRSDPFGINNVEMRYSEDKLTIFAIGGKGGVSFEGTFDMKTKKFTSENIEPEIKVPDIFGFRTMVISEGEEISEEDYVEFSEEEFHEFMALLQIGAWTEVPEDWKGKGSVLEPANILISSEKGKNATMYISPEEGKTLIMIKWGHGQEFKKYYFADKSIAFEAEEFRKELAAKNAG